MELEFSQQFSKNTQVSNFMHNGQVGAELFDADGQTRQTGLMKLMVALRNFANTHNKSDIGNV
jgi:hypothetical protein